jgi:ABC-type phosphate transport system substrate-binding protein
MAVKVKSVAWVVALAAFLGLAPSGFAQTAVFNAAGSSAAFNAFALAGLYGSGTTSPGPCGSFVWTQKNGGEAHDNRNTYTNPPNSIDDVAANLWIEWDNSTSPTVVCAYLAVDSAVGQRVFFANPRGQLDLPTSFTCAAPPAGGNLIPGITDAALTTAVCNAIFGNNGSTSSCITGSNCTFNAAPTDIRPEDALWATQRTYDSLPVPYACGPGQTLGYSPGPAPDVGTTINSFFSTKFVQPALWALSGSDPISGLPVASWVTTDVGAQSLLVLVNTSDTTANGLGSTKLTNVIPYQLAAIWGGVANTTEFIVPGSTVTDITPLHVLQREPLSGTYNTFEYTTIGPSTYSQECGVTNPNGGAPYNPLDLVASSGGTRQRTIGTGEMISEISSTEDSIGYAFFSFGNVASLVTTGKYLTVNSEDPLYANGGNPNGTGSLPTCSTPPCKLTFPNIANGNYPLWNVLRVTTASPVPSSIASLLSDAELQAKNEISDFLPVPLVVLRSHFTDPGQSNTPANGLLCTGETQVGGDMGGQILTTTTDDNFIKETGGFGVSNGTGGCKAGKSGTLGRELTGFRYWNQ